MTTLSNLKRHRVLISGAVLTAFLIVFALLSIFWTPGDPTRIRIAMRLKGPLEAGLLGTDQYGRDVVSLLMVGAKNSLAIAWPAVGIGAVCGVLLGSAAAAWKGLFEEIAMRACDVTFAFPAILSAIMLGAAIGQGPTAAIWAIALFNVPVFARVTRGAARRVWAMDYILAARASGKTPWAIAWQDVLPNIASVIVIQLTIQLAVAIIAEAGFSFIGIGVSPPNPSWGRMLKESQTFLQQAPHLAVAPGIAIALAVLGLNLLGDGLRDLLDPDMRRRGRGR